MSHFSASKYEVLYDLWLLYLSGTSDFEKISTFNSSNPVSRPLEIVKKLSDRILMLEGTRALLEVHSRAGLYGTGLSMVASRRK